MLNLLQWRRLTLLLSLLLIIAGCSSTPRTRLGCLPFPGLLTLYTQADPNDLGTHRYESRPRLMGGERSRGILYLKRAGFVDLAHVREAMDWSWYAKQKVRATLRAGREDLELPGYDGCPFYLTFTYPQDWHELDRDARRDLIEELSLRIGERVAFNAMTWHEIITWFDYRTTLIVPEKQSSFTYEDTPSHLVGIRAADLAMRHPEKSWDADATAALNETLKELGVVSKEEEETAVELVKGKWWKDGVCIRRNIDVGHMNGDIIRPWLVRGGPPAWGDAAPVEFRVPTCDKVGGRDFSKFWRMEIKPQLLIPSAVKRVSTLKDHRIDPEIHFPILMDEIQLEMKKELGENCDRPYDD